MQALDLVINDKEITIINIYWSNNDNAHFFPTLNEYLQKKTEKKIIIGGDFNTVLNETLDKRNGQANSHKLCRKKDKRYDRFI